MENTGLKILQIVDNRCCEAIVGFAGDQCRALGNLGHHVTLVNTNIPLTADVAGLTKSDKDMLATITMISQFPVNVFRFSKYIKRIKPDIVAVHQGESHFVAAFGIKKSGLKIPLVRFRWDNRPRGVSFMARWVTNHLTAGVGVPSEKAMKFVSGAFNTKHIGVFYPGIDANYFKPRAKDQAFARKLGLDSRSIVVGLIGSLEIAGGHRHFIEAAKLASLQNPDIRFVIAGKDGSAKAEHLKMLVEKWRMRDKVIFSGHIRDVRQVMSILDIGIIATAGFKPISRVLLEYMAMGIPVIATSTNQSPEILGETGLLVSPGDPVAMAEAIGKMAKDKDQRSNLGFKGLTAVTNYYTIALLGKRSESFFREILGGTD